jgi:uncharacterized protein
MRNRRACLLGIVLAASACARPMDRIALEMGGAEFRVEVARTDHERERGLMRRKGIGDREGMLFVFDSDQRLSFWMKDTTIPLSIAFLSSTGRVEEIVDMEPLSLRIIRSRFSCRYALEVSDGTYTALGIKEGDVVHFPEGFR